MEGGFFRMPFKVVVKKEKCNACEECLEVCTAQVFEMKEGKSDPVHSEGCLGCQSCVEVCTESAISVDELRVELSETCLSLLREIL
jgi:NAD-dependent dihydropyrimidine dehydrogenase PreA subunit